MFADIVIIGGGASGLAAAIAAKEAAPEAGTVVVERLDRVGKKILATGNGRCNLGNADRSSGRYGGSFRKDAGRVLAEAPSPEEFFSELGVLCVSDAAGRLYPRGENAAAVLNSLRIRLDALGVREETGFDVVSFERKGAEWELLSADGRRLGCRRIVIAAGGCAAPQYGTDGAMLRFLRGRGYEIEKLYPAIAQLRVSPEALKGLKGVRAKAKVFAEAGGKVVASEEGEVQFTENALSGICVFNLARCLKGREGRLSIRLDLAADMSAGELEKYLRRMRRDRASLGLGELLTGAFTKNLAVYLAKRLVGRPLSEEISSLSDEELLRIVDGIKSLSFKVEGAAPWKLAQATSGGVSRSCVGEDFASKLDEGVFLCGEILDVDGDCGGFNLQWAWASGTIAGKSCAASLKGGRR